MPKHLGSQGVFVGIVAIAEPGISRQAVLGRVPNDTVSLWCVWGVAVGTNSRDHRTRVIVKFLHAASGGDERRAAGYLASTGLFTSVRIAKVRHYY